MKNKWPGWMKMGKNCHDNAKMTCPTFVIISKRSITSGRQTIYTWPFLFF